MENMSDGRNENGFVLASRHLVRKSSTALMDKLLEYERNQAFEDNEATLNRRELVAKPAPLKVVKSSLRNDELLLEYVLDERTSYCIAITKSDEDLHARCRQEGNRGRCEYVPKGSG